MRNRNEYQRAWRAANADKIRAYAAANRERLQARRRKYYEKNKERIAARRRAHYAENRDRLVAKQRAYNRANKRSASHGLTAVEMDARLAAQGGGCAVCGSKSPGGVRGWHGDHDHRTGRFRAVLCGPCNSGIGFLKDDPARCRAAAAYLDRHQKLQELL